MASSLCINARNSPPSRYLEQPLDSRPFNMIVRCGTGEEFFLAKPRILPLSRYLSRYPSPRYIFNLSPGVFFVLTCSRSCPIDSASRSLWRILLDKYFPSINSWPSARSIRYRSDSFRDITCHCAIDQIQLPAVRSIIANPLMSFNPFEAAFSLPSHREPSMAHRSSARVIRKVRRIP